mgnify:CR=1 FL=1
MKQKLFAILLALVLVLSLTGCAGGGKQSTDASKPESSAESSKPESESESDVEPTSLLPYTGDEVTFDYFWFDTGAVFEGKENLPMVAALQEKLGNIKLNLEILSYDDYNTKFPLLLAGGEIPDMMLLGTDPAGVVGTYGQNGIFLDWNDYMEQYMPNLYKYSKERGVFKSLQDGEGHQYALPLNIITEDRVMQNWIANVTLLEEIGLGIPETQEQFLEACRKVKAEKGIVPIQRRDGILAVAGSVGLMYTSGGDYALQYYPGDGKWAFGPTRDGSEYKEFLTFMHTLWEEGLIDHELNTQTEDQVLDYYYAGQFLFTHDYHSRFASYKGDGKTPFEDGADFTVKIIPAPKATASLAKIDMSYDGQIYWGLFSNVKTKNPELLAACIDLMFSDEVAMIANYGIEGETYTIGDDGLPYYTDAISTAYGLYKGEKDMYAFGRWGSPWLRAFGISDTRSTRLIEETPSLYEGVDEIIKLLDEGKCQPQYNYGFPSISVDESAEISDILGPVNTYNSECMIKFITGDMNIETEWDTFIEKLKGYGDMDRVCEILNSYEMPKYAGNWR